MEVAPPAKRLANASRKFDQLYHKHLHNLLFGQIQEEVNLGAWLATDNITSMFYHMAKATDKLSHLAEIIDRENGKLCNHLAAVAKTRETREVSWKIAAITTPAKTFHGFTKLPVELRMMIWEAAAQPTTCCHVATIIEEARKPVPRNAASVGPYDAATMIYAGEDMGMWTACRESRRVIAHAYFETHQRLLRQMHELAQPEIVELPDDEDDEEPEAEDGEQSQAEDGEQSQAEDGEQSQAQDGEQPQAQDGEQWPPCCSRPINTRLLEMQGRRVGRFNRLAIQFQRHVCSLDASLKLYYLAGEHVLRRHTPVQTAAIVGGAGHQHQDNFMVAALRQIYEIQRELPRGANQGAIPVSALRQLNRDLRMEFLLGLPWS